MGNALSEEEQEKIMEEAYNLEDPGADKQLNSGTSAPNCQPKHTQKDHTEQKQQNGGSSEAGPGPGPGPGVNNGSNSNSETTSHKNRRTSSTMSVREVQEDRRKRQHTTNNNASSSSSSSLSSQAQQQQQQQQQQEQQQQEMTAAAAQQQKKLSYFQMARLGYQELVNAIIRPPRADYKVRRCACVWRQYNR